MKNLLTNVFGKTLLTLVPLLFCGAGKADAAALFTINLDGSNNSIPSANPYVRFVQQPTLNNTSGAYETVLKINFAPENNIDIAKFMIEYDGNPQGYTVNIGDSQSNNGEKGDWADQSNDAEMQILNHNMTIFSNDASAAP